jgi:hypothetical protein
MIGCFTEMFLARYLNSQKDTTAGFAYQHSSDWISLLMSLQCSSDLFYRDDRSASDE